MPRRILVTRPQPGNARTAERLERAGFHPLSLPLAELRPVREIAAQTGPQAAAVAITSSNALRFAPDELVDRLRRLPLFAVGAQSARYAQGRGFNVAAHGGSDAAELAGLVASSLKSGALVVYPCGKVRRPEFESRMAASGIRILPIETYDTVQVSYSTEFLNRILGTDPVDAVLLHSANAAQYLSALVTQDQLSQVTDDTWFFCFSENIANRLKAFPGNRIVVARKPSDEELVSALRSVFG